MVKYSVLKRTAEGRVGEVTEWGGVVIHFETPACLLYTKGGHIPHLTWDTVEQKVNLAQPSVYQLTLPSLWVFTDDNFVIYSINNKLFLSITWVVYMPQTIFVFLELFSH